MASLLLVCLLLTPVAAIAGEFRLPVGLTYASGPNQLMDKVKENYNVIDDQGARFGAIPQAVSPCGFMAGIYAVF